MKDKITVAIVFGGKSAEHEVSLQSAKHVYHAIDKNKYNPILIGITKQGKWLLQKESEVFLESTNPHLIKLNTSSQSLSLVPQGDGEIVSNSSPENKLHIDVVFPILHGPFGEDGTVQGMLKLANVPFVGAGVLGSAIGMDKDVMKRLLHQAKIPTPRFLVFKDFEKISFEHIANILGLPFFIKPANLGSSVGVSKVRNKKEFTLAVSNAFLYDRKILIEEFIDGREIECSVLGNDEPIASLPGEVISTHDFYSYEAKYIDEHGALLEIPAKLPTTTIKQVQKLAIKTFQCLSCEGLGRVDFFINKNNKVLVNEINTIPGFTAISMYPKLWEASGINYTSLIDRLITLAIERFSKEKKLRSTYYPTGSSQ